MVRWVEGGREGGRDSDTERRVFFIFLDIFGKMCVPLEKIKNVACRNRRGMPLNI